MTWLLTQPSTKATDDMATKPQPTTKTTDDVAAETTYHKTNR
jgi:hypothetical protein